MTAQTSIGPGEASPADGARKTQATTEGIDAQNANEFDMEHGLAGQEAKPFSSPSQRSAGQASTAKPADRSSSAKQAGLINERRNPGREDGGGPR